MSRPPELDLASVFSLLGTAVDDTVLQALAGTGLRRGHGYLVQRLLAGPATATEIAVELGVSQQAVSKALGELAALGYVGPAGDADDRRRRPVALTQAGRRVVRVARETRADVDARVRAAVGDERFEACRDVLLDALDVLGLGEQVRRRAVRPPDGALSG
ncbi:MarR family winged helix-turn-helix transcriptional regulator [Geodermatophilus arenarius]|uniref:MarR family winged helix-turn-helix transcriptional regulator n=1 Tax=Geodermatophilus arenarius TaxID=1137990 RepID=A0ABV9LEX4_9ACTN